MIDYFCGINDLATFFFFVEARGFHKSEGILDICQTIEERGSSGFGAATHLLSSI